MLSFQYEVHPDDLAIKNEPTFFEQLTMGAKGKENDSDEELEEEEEEQKEKKTPGENSTRKEQDIPKGKKKVDQS